VQAAAGADFLSSGRIVWRAADGSIHVTPRAEFESLAAAGTVTSETPVFGTLAESVGEWRSSFERPARESWAASLVR
jgi:hypothetical protein